jgi:putative SOS response-associated peptidase YedK
MCNRYFRDSDKQRLVEAFYLGNREDLPLEIAPSYNIAPTTRQT